MRQSLFPVADIIINRDQRQRRELKGIDELAASISQRGLINPITITEEGVLIAGERRLTLVKRLGWFKIPVTFRSDLSNDELHLIELEENTQRLDITWQEQVEATAKYHQLRDSMEEEWNVAATAKALNLSYAIVSDRLLVHNAMEDGNEEILTADKFSVARNLCRRQDSRRKETLKAAVLDGVQISPADAVQTAMLGVPSVEPAPEEPEKTAVHPHLFHADFHEWTKTYSGPTFNLIHCDFPYGIGFDKQRGQNSSNRERYDDSFETYKACLETLSVAPISESAHLIFWFSPVHFEFTKYTLTKMGWIINPFPFIWAKSDNSGIVPDSNRGGRRTYETAFLGTRGGHKIVRPVALHWHGARGEAVHASVKPRPMLEHLLRMYVDDSTLFLDPTCGSGNAVREAANLGASQAIGLEQNETYWQDAMRQWPAK